MESIDLSWSEIFTLLGSLLAGWFLCYYRQTIYFWLMKQLVLSQFREARIIIEDVSSDEDL